jgi:hypothetical protein
MFDHEKLQVYGKAVDLDLGVERAFQVETEAIAGKEMLGRISAMVAGF